MADKNFKVKNGLTIEGGATDTTITADGAGSILVGGSALNFAPANLSINAQTGTSYTAVLADKDRLVEINNASANTFTVPLDSSVNFPVGAQINVLQTGAGQTTLAGGGDLSWTTRSVASISGATQIEYGNGIWVRSGGFNGPAFVSTDTITWVTYTVGLGATALGLAYGNGIWLISGYKSNSADGGIRISTNNAVTWTTILTSAGLFSDTGISALAYGNGIFVAGGYGGGIATSTNGTSWTTRTSNLTNRLRTIHFSNGVWVAGGDSGQIRTSTDAITWTTRTSNMDRIEDVSYGNNIWVAVGNNNLGPAGEIRTSTDAVTWTTRTSNFGNSVVTSVFYGNGIFLAGGNGGAVRSSTDGISWTTVSNVNTTNRITSIGYNNVNLWALAPQFDSVRTSPFQSVTLNSTPGSKLRAQWSAATLIKRAANTWLAIGDLSA